MNKYSDKPPPKAEQVVECKADLLNHRTAFKDELPHLAGGGAE
jgi:hypothetical protein